MMISFFMQNLFFFACFDRKLLPQICGVRFLKVYQLKCCFISRAWERLLNSFERRSSKLTFGLSYHILLTFLWEDLGDITGASWQKTTDLQFSTKMCYDKGASVNLRMIAPVWVEIWVIFEKYRRFTE